ncbi:MAG: hypothetical protein LBL46_01585, partial [Rickettsiales bacterium]|nr:hypothetical protein [Rickettsiales bacterium]
DCFYLYADDDDIHPLATQCNAILDFMAVRGIKNIAIEVNGIGNAIPEIMRREAAARGREVFISRIVNKENKAERILGAIEPLLSAGKLFAHERVRESGLMDEFADWTPSGWTHDDGLDALAGALRLPPIPLRPRPANPRQFRAMMEFKV